MTTRDEMIERHLQARGITDERVLDAFRAVPREAFVDEALRGQAYEDTPLPIGAEQTISQPYIVALTLVWLALRGGERVLEIGTGSGYAAAVLAQIAGEVFTVERVDELARTARDRLHHLGFTNVHVRHADGARGWPEEAPFDGIAVAAGAGAIPEPLLDQLTVGGRLVLPLGDVSTRQVLTRVTRRSPRRFEEEPITDVRFVPLVTD